MQNDIFSIDEPILKYKLFFKGKDFVTLINMVHSIELNHHPIVKSRLIKQLLHWMYKNAIIICKWHLEN